VPVPLRVLIVEDSAFDAELMTMRLIREGFELDWRRVQSEEEYLAALVEKFDLILSDWNLPQFSGLQALRLMQEYKIDLPFIIVSGSIVEESAIHALRLGAQDYLLKDRLERLGQAVNNALEQKRMQREQKHTLEALADSEAELRALFASMNDLVLVIDRDGVYRKIAPTNPGLLVKPAQELLGQRLADVFPLAQAENFIQVIRSVLEHQKVETISYQLIIQDRPTCFETTISPMPGDCTLWVVRDTTEHRQAEKAFKKSNEQLTLAIEGSRIGIWDWMIETGHTEINDCWAEMVGYTWEELGSSTNPWLKLCHPEDDLKAQVLVQRHLAGETPYCEYEARMRHKDGHWVWVLVRCRVTQRDEHGKPIRISGTHLDISERKRAEEEALEREFWLRESQRIGRIGSYSLDIRSQSWLSSAVLDDIFGIEQNAEKTTASWGEVVHPEQRAEMLDYFAKHVVAGKNHFDREYKIVRAKDGQERWVWGRGELIFDPDGNPIRMIGTIQDITERKQDDETLRKASEDLKDAYEATLQGWSNALEMRERETAGHSQRVVRMIRKLAERMNLKGEDLVQIRRGALLHDIGKMGIPDSILLKPGPLTEDEWVVMRQHPVYAAQLLSKIPYLLPALDIPHYHHERWDGSGYPDGLKGAQIPLTARLFAVVDVWDALSSNRSYRPAWTGEAVIKYLRDQSGKQFDPAIVEAFLSQTT
jgi:PAS domain S-box-containing protein/putative nucleotidyltransferase with HDIG domain